MGVLVVQIELALVPVSVLVREVSLDVVHLPHSFGHGDLVGLRDVRQPEREIHTLFLRPLGAADIIHSLSVGSHRLVDQDGVCLDELREVGGVQGVGFGRVGRRDDRGTICRGIYGGGQVVSAELKWGLGGSVVFLRAQTAAVALLRAPVRWGTGPFLLHEIKESLGD